MSHTDRVAQAIYDRDAEETRCLKEEFVKRLDLLFRAHGCEVLTPAEFHDLAIDAADEWLKRQK